MPALRLERAVVFGLFAFELLALQAARLRMFLRA